MVDVAVHFAGEVVEDVRLQRVCRFHNEGVEIEPPKPSTISLRITTAGQTYHSALGYLAMALRTVSTFSQLSRHS